MKRLLLTLAALAAADLAAFAAVMQWCRRGDMR